MWWKAGDRELHEPSLLEVNVHGRCAQKVGRETAEEWLMSGEQKRGFVAVAANLLPHVFRFRFGFQSPRLQDLSFVAQDFCGDLSSFDRSSKRAREYEAWLDFRVTGHGKHLAKLAPSLRR